MEIQPIEILLKLIISHLLADFLFQPKSIAEGKKQGFKSWHLYIHIIIVGVTTYIILGEWDNWKAPLIIMSIHGLIDWLKITIKYDNTTLYLLDQALHLLTLVLYWALVTDHTILGLFMQTQSFVFSPKALVIIIAYLTVTMPLGILIGYLTRRWQNEINSSLNSSSSNQESLSHAGQWIGMIERVLILTFILMGEWRAIGFLLGAKSVFRFGDLKDAQDRKRTEYILIGTLISFTTSVILGIFVTKLLTSLTSI